MDYQKLVCWGDSQTFGARSYGCYPLYLGQFLNADTRYKWQVFSRATNGHTARDLWFRQSEDVLKLADVHQACVLIGTNDVGAGSPLEVFGEYYRQLIGALEISGYRVVYCGEIPPIWPDGHAFFSRESEERRPAYNDCLREVVQASPIAKLVTLADLGAECYTDPVHLNEAGNREIARRYAKAIMDY